MICALLLKCLCLLLRKILLPVLGTLVGTLCSSDTMKRQSNYLRLHSTTDTRSSSYLLSLKRALAPLKCQAMQHEVLRCMFTAGNHFHSHDLYKLINCSGQSSNQVFWRQQMFLCLVGQFSLAAGSLQAALTPTDSSVGDTYWCTP